MTRKWREESLRIIDERYRAVRKVFPNMEPRDLFRHVDQKYPFDIHDPKAYSAWLVAVQDYKVKVTRPDIVQSYGLEAAPLFDEEK
jgi:hypothetical protein